jgi:hypothetical protein
LNSERQGVYMSEEEMFLPIEIEEEEEEEDEGDFEEKDSQSNDGEKKTFQFDENEYGRRRWGRYDEESFDVQFDKLSIRIASSDVIRLHTLGS